MENKKFKIAEFSALVGAAPKTIYNAIKTGEILTEIEVQRGRKITLVITNDEQISELQKRYGKNSSMKLQYYENETKITENENTLNETEIQNQKTEAKEADLQNRENEIIKSVIEFSKSYNENLLNYNDRILNLQEQLLNEKAKIPLLEDKAGREGLYLQEIKEIKEQNKKNLRLFTGSLAIVFVLLVISIGFIIYLLLNPRTITNTETVIKEVPKEIIKYVKR